MSRFRILALAVPLAACAAAAPLVVEPAPVRVGVYDSRAVVIAFTHSSRSKEQIQKLIAQRDAATDPAVRASFEKQGEALQDRRHRQGFSTASIADVLEHVEGELPGIAAASNVDVLVSKWDLAYRREGVEFVDVTAAMIAPFAPDDRVKAMIADLKNHEPLSLYGTDWEAIDRH